MGYNKDFYNSLLSVEDNTKYVAKKVYKIIRNNIQCNSLVDVGCGVGTWLSVFEDETGGEILGIDGEWVEEEQLLIRKEQFLRQNLNNRIRIEKRFDMCQTLEVAEHLNPERADSFVEDLTNLSDVILFSAAIPFQGGVGHINEQWPSYWIEKFKKHQYNVYDVIRTELWDDEKITCLHYKQNILLFCKEGSKNQMAIEKMKLKTHHIYDMVSPAVYSIAANSLNSKTYKFSLKIAQVINKVRRKK